LGDFLANLTPTPIFYQHMTDVVFGGLISNHLMGFTENSTPTPAAVLKIRIRNWLAVLEFGQPNAEIGRKMADLFLALQQLLIMKVVH